MAGVPLGYERFRPWSAGLKQQGPLSFSPLSLSPLAWARSSISTLYQDSAGNTPVTGAGQKILYVADQSGNGNHAIQTVEADAPVYQTGPPRIVFGAGDSLAIDFGASVGTDCTIGIAVPGIGASILTGQTIGSTYTLTSDACEVVIVDRALTEAETSRLTAYLDDARFGVAVEGQDEELLAGQDGFTLIQEVA